MDITSASIAQYYSLAHSYLGPVLPPFAGSALSLLVAFVIFAILLSILVMGFSYMFGWVERKALSRMQSRHGPTYVGPWGLLQNMADVVKLLAKETILPDAADTPLFQMILPLVYATFMLMLAFTPLNSSFIGVNTSLGLIIVFLLLSFVPLLLFLAGWTSGNKYGSISAQRSVVMLLSYEIPLLLVIVAVAAASGSYSFSAIVAAQSHIWYAVLMPIGFVLFFIMMLAELERPPFDLREADNELIAGWLTDVSPPYYALTLFLDYTRMFFGTLLISLLFLGGWNGPVLPPFIWLMVKVVVLTLIIVAVRATTVRMRLDRLLHFGWVYMLPLSVINLLVAFALFVK